MFRKSCNITIHSLTVSTCVYREDSAEFNLHSFGVTNKFFYRIYSVSFLVCFFLFCLIKTFSLILFTS